MIINGRPPTKENGGFECFFISYSVIAEGERKKKKEDGEVERRRDGCTSVVKFRTNAENRKRWNGEGKLGKIRKNAKKKKGTIRQKYRDGQGFRGKKESTPGGFRRKGRPKMIWNGKKEKTEPQHRCNRDG